MFTFLWLLFALFALATALVATALPPWIAYRRHSRDTVLIALVSLFLGWSILGWIAALAWALYGPARASEALDLSQPQTTTGPRFLRRI
jgi:hypothetical protein